jgi:hypothetical protein
MGLAMNDFTADTAAAMLKALRSADMSNQPLAVGLADALEKLIVRESENFYDSHEGKACVVRTDYIDLIANHLRNNNNHA